MRCCLVVTTHERPDALARVLASLETQTRLPDEVVVADDGSGPATADLVRRAAKRLRCAVRHVWQPHEGFRAGRIRNAAIAGTDCGYLLLLDGDMVLHPAFVADHLAIAREGYYTQGVRILLGPRATARLVGDTVRVPGPMAPGLGGLRRVYAFRVPALSMGLRRAANAVVAVKSCNQGFWRADLLRANGFDEAMTGWGSEDKELCARLENAGVRRQTLIFAGIAWHLDHVQAPRTSADANRARCRETVRTGRRRCEVGLDRHFTP
jgi:GT2 family glycosyltransferase